MSITITCDYCGEAVADDDYATVKVDGYFPKKKRSRYFTFALGHFHTDDERGCYWKIAESVKATNASGEHPPGHEPESPEEPADAGSTESDGPAYWGEQLPAAREDAILNLLGDRAMTIREMQAELNAGRERIYALDTHVRSTVARLHVTGRLARASEPGLRGRARYRYTAVLRPLEGLIADLDRAFRENES